MSEWDLSDRIDSREISTPRRPTPIATTALAFTVLLDSEGAVEVRLIA